MKFFAALYQFLAEINFPAHERLSVTITVHSASGQARLIDAMVKDVGPISIETRAHVDILKSRKVAHGAAFGIPFTIERRA